MKKLLSAALIVIAVATACEKSDDNKPVNTKSYTVNSNTSVAEWRGATPDPQHFHIGTFKVEGALQTDNNLNIQGGDFVIPISSIQNFDLPQEMKPVLLDHLKSADFFNMALHPNAKFKITKVENYTGNGTGVFPGTNKVVTGDFSMHGQTHPISIPAKIYTVSDSLKVEGTFKIDRSKWGMTKYTDPNAEDYIIPDADIHLKMQLAKG